MTCENQIQLRAALRKYINMTRCTRALPRRRVWCCLLLLDCEIYIEAPSKELVKKAMINYVVGHDLHRQYFIDNIFIFQA